MKFFVPSKHNGETDEEAYQRIKTIAVQSYPAWKITDDRILGLHYRHNNKPYYAEVGKPDAERGGEIVTAIFSTAENDMCLIGTTHSRRGGTFVTMADSTGVRPILFDAK